MARKSVLASKVETEVKLLQRHVSMLKAIVQNQPIGIIRLSEMLNYPQHKVRYSMRILEQEGFIKPSPHPPPQRDVHPPPAKGPVLEADPGGGGFDHPPPRRRRDDGAARRVPRLPE